MRYYNELTNGRLQENKVQWILKENNNVHFFCSSPKDKNIVFSLSRSEVKAASQLTENYLAFKDI